MTVPRISPSRRPATIGAGLALLLSVFAAGVASAHSPPTNEAAEVLPGFRPGDTVRDHGLSVRAPGRGGMVWGELHFADGTWQALQVSTLPDGRVSARHLGDDSRGVRVSSAARTADDARDKGTGAAAITSTAPTSTAE